MSLVDAIQISVVIAFIVLCIRLETGGGATGRFVCFWCDVPRRRPLRGCILWFVVILAIDALETTHDDQLTAALEFDFSGAIQSLEGSLTVTIQQWLGHPWLTPVFAFAYVVGFLGLLLGLAHAYDRANDVRRLLMVTYAYAVNYLAVLPFYLFCPVKEPWSHPGSGVAALTDLHLGTWVMELIRPMSGIDNCFPSYHVSLTTTLMLIALDGPRNALSRFAVICGTLVIASTVVLGFHWVTDAVVGIAFGAVIHVFGKRYASRFVEARDARLQSIASESTPAEVRP